MTKTEPVSITNLKKSLRETGGFFIGSYIITTKSSQISLPYAHYSFV